MRRPHSYTRQQSRCIDERNKHEARSTWWGVPGGTSLSPCILSPCIFREGTGTLLAVRSKLDGRDRRRWWRVVDGIVIRTYWECWQWRLKKRIFSRVALVRRSDAFLLLLFFIWYLVFFKQPTTSADHHPVSDTGTYHLYARSNGNRHDCTMRPVFLSSWRFEDDDDDDGVLSHINYLITLKVCLCSLNSITSYIKNASPWEKQTSTRYALVPTAVPVRVCVLHIKPFFLPVDIQYVRKGNKRYCRGVA